MDIESKTKIIQGFVEKGNYHAAMNTTISALNECRRIDNKLGIDSLLDVINSIANSMAREFGR